MSKQTGFTAETEAYLFEREEIERMISRDGYGRGEIDIRDYINTFVFEMSARLEGIIVLCGTSSGIICGMVESNYIGKGRGDVRRY